jgi:serine/threonine protein kinase
MNPQPPTQIGKYRIERELGRGTMGVVYQAKDTTLGRTVALKTFGAAASMAAHEREAFEQRFLSEARISATLEDPHVVGVYDVGRDFESGLLYMALEYVRGETLADRLARGPLPWKESARIVAKIARALEIAHANGIVHRDVKPANIMLTAAGEPKVMDFGIAKASAVHLTLAGQVFGTPRLHVARTGLRRTGGRPLRHLLPRLRPPRARDRGATVRRIHDGCDHHENPSR